MARSNRQFEISALLRLAELCTSDEQEQKQKYMKRIELLLGNANETAEEVRIAGNTQAEEAVITFMDSLGSVDMVLNHVNSIVYEWYLTFCSEGNIKPLSNAVFSRTLCRIYGINSHMERLNGRVVRVYRERC